VFKDFEYIDHPCAGLDFADDIVCKTFSKEDFKEEYCFHVNLDGILNKKKYYIFNLNNIKDKALLFNVLKKIIKKLNLYNFKNEIYKYVLIETGINLNSFFYINFNKKFTDKKIDHFIIKVDMNNNFGLYIRGLNVNDSSNNSSGRSLSIKDGIINYKLYSITKYSIDERDASKAEKIWAEEINLTLNKLESYYEPIDYIFSNKNFKASYITKEVDGSKGFYYRRINKNESSKKNILRIYF